MVAHKVLRNRVVADDDQEPLVIRGNPWGVTSFSVRLLLVTMSIVLSNMLMTAGFSKLCMEITEYVPMFSRAVDISFFIAMVLVHSFSVMVFWVFVAERIP